MINEAARGRVGGGRCLPQPPAPAPGTSPAFTCAWAVRSSRLCRGLAEQRLRGAGGLGPLPKAPPPPPVPGRRGRGERGGRRG
ncbi:hypothetical protein LUU34_01100200 [Aix galericulata]|nr:hypothetical protein LUU34_01100200 [Aix galericulata]